jgi:hypothetical protein
MKQKAQMDSPSTFMGVYVTKDQKRMDKVREIPATQLTHHLDVSNTSKPGIMEIDGTVHREIPTSKQVGTFIPLMDSWEIMAPSSSLSTFRRLAAWVNSSAPSFPLGRPDSFHPSLFEFFPCFSRPFSPYLSFSLPRSLNRPVPSPPSQIPGSCAPSFPSPRSACGL